MTAPPDLSMMLDPDARLFFERLPQSRQRRYVEPIIQARRPETREHRVARAVRMLREERSRRPC